MRFSTVPFSTDPSSVGNKFIHLTNSSIQKHNMGSVPNANNETFSRRGHCILQTEPGVRKGGTKLKLAIYGVVLKKIISMQQGAQ